MTHNVDVQPERATSRAIDCNGLLETLEVRTVLSESFAAYVRGQFLLHSAFEIL
jgi:hypothetical protein